MVVSELVLEVIGSGRGYGFGFLAFRGIATGDGTDDRREVVDEPGEEDHGSGRLRW